ncbi:MAG: right-handed parallel beta-helix repeat-containing protein [bacterium]|nr:right-handed parallel beta-helix repeat-containing protein [bacterium]
MVASQTKNTVFTIVLVPLLIGFFFGTYKILTIQDATDVSQIQAATINISTASHLQAAVSAARPGDVLAISGSIDLTSLTSTFKIENVHGTATAPITFRGGTIRGAKSSRMLEITNTSYLIFEDMTFDGIGGDSVIYMQQARHNVFRRNIIKNGGGECFRMRDNSTNNSIIGNTVFACGVGKWDPPTNKNAEGIYIGTADNQSASPDKTMLNYVANNIVQPDLNNPKGKAGNECIDLKEATERNLIENNTCAGQWDKNSGGMESRGNYNIFKGNTFNSVICGAGIRLGGDPNKTQGFGNWVIGNNIRDFNNADPACPDSAVGGDKVLIHGAVKIESTVAQGYMCGNNVNGKTPAVSGSMASLVNAQEFVGACDNNRVSSHLAQYSFGSSIQGYPGSGGTNPTPTPIPQNPTPTPVTQTPQPISQVGCTRTVASGASIQDAIDQMGDNQVLCVSPGVYRGGGNPGKSYGTIKIQNRSNFTLRGLRSGSQVAKIVATRTEALSYLPPDNSPISAFEPYDRFSLIKVINGNNITLEGLDIDGYYYPNLSSLTNGEPVLNRLVWFQKTKNSKILNNRIVNGGSECVRLKSESQRNEVAYNTISGCGYFQFGPLNSVERLKKNGEAVYIGTDPVQIDVTQINRQAYWGHDRTLYTDRSSFNKVHHNVLNPGPRGGYNGFNYGNECVDIKEDFTSIDEFKKLVLADTGSPASASLVAAQEARGEPGRNEVYNNSCEGQFDGESAAFDARGPYNSFYNNRIFGTVRGAAIRLRAGEKPVRSAQYPASIAPESITDGTANIAVTYRWYATNNVIRKNVIESYWNDTSYSHNERTNYVVKTDETQAGGDGICGNVNAQGSITFDRPFAMLSGIIVNRACSSDASAPGPGNGCLGVGCIGTGPPNTSLGCNNNSFFSITSPSGFTFTKDCVGVNRDIYAGDNRFTFFQTHQYIQNISYVKTGNVAEKDSLTLSWSLNTTHPSQIYLMYRKIPGQGVPAWITQQYTKQTSNDFSNINQFVLRKNEQGLIGLYDIYKKNGVTIGTESFGPASDVTNKAFSMYFVALSPQ